MISFSHDTPVHDVVQRTQELIRDVVLPMEEEQAGNAHALRESDRRVLQEAARAAGVFAPHVDAEHGGLGLNLRDRSPVFEAAGYSLFGPLALNIAAPDEGNAHLLNLIATSAQKERYLRPMVTGGVRSCFAMTEPSPGAGSDPTALCTTATRTAGGWVINGHKWFITGANGAAWAIVMARTSGEVGDRGGATMFLVETDSPGFRRVRDVETLDQSMIGGHAELVFTDLEVTDDAVLGQVDKGFEHAQLRLGPARLTHCMRWLGTARRASDIAIARAAERELFGSRLGELGMAQAMIADNEIDIEASRALLLKACWDVDTGAPQGQITSITKTFVAEAVNRVVDRSLQLCGSLGVSADTSLSRMYREVRPFRIYDGPSETHRWAIAKRALAPVRRR